MCLLDSGDYLAVPDSGGPGVWEREDSSREMRRAFRASTFATSKSKMASNSATKVTQPQTIQNKMNQIGRSRGSSADCKNVDPENNSANATRSRTNMTSRRVF